MDRFLKSNTVLRIIALILACLIWLGVNAPATGGNGVNTGMTERFAYPVHVDVAQDMVVTQIDKPTVEVAVTGDTLVVSSLPASMLGVTVIADARGLGPGKHVLRLAATNMPPVNYAIEPSTVTVNIESKTIAQANVQVNLQGKPAVGYNAGTPATETQAVQVTGASSAVRDVAAVIANISVQGATKQISQVVNLLPVDKYGKAVPGVELSPATVTVTVPVQPPQVTATIVPQIVGSPATGYAVAGVDVKPGTVIVNGLATVTANVQSINLPIDVTGFRKTQVVRLKIPVRAGITGVQPGTVVATVRIEQSVSKSFTAIPIQLQNVPKDKQIKLTGPQTVDLTVQGPASIVNRMLDTDLKVFIDASKLKTNSASATLEVSLPDWVRATTIAPSSVPVQVM